MSTKNKKNPGSVFDSGRTVKATTDNSKKNGPAKDKNSAAKTTASGKKNDKGTASAANNGMVKTTASDTGYIKTTTTKNPKVTNKPANITISGNTSNGNSALGDQSYDDTYFANDTRYQNMMAKVVKGEGVDVSDSAYWLISSARQQGYTAATSSVGTGTVYQTDEDRENGTGVTGELDDNDWGKWNKVYQLNSSIAQSDADTAKAMCSTYTEDELYEAAWEMYSALAEIQDDEAYHYTAANLANSLKIIEDYGYQHGYNSFELYEQRKAESELHKASKAYKESKESAEAFDAGKAAVDAAADNMEFTGNYVEYLTEHPELMPYIREYLPQGDYDYSDIVGGNPEMDIHSRTKVPAKTMQAAGWETEDGSYSTVDTVSYTIDDTEIIMTPIRPDGTVLTPEELDDYVDSLKLNDDGTIDFSSDPDVLVVGAEYLPDMSEEDREKYIEDKTEQLHLKQADEYADDRYSDEDIMTALYKAREKYDAGDDPAGDREKAWDEAKSTFNSTMDTIDKRYTYIHERTAWEAPLQDEKTKEISESYQDQVEGYTQTQQQYNAENGLEADTNAEATQDQVVLDPDGVIAAKDQEKIYREMNLDYTGITVETAVDENNDDSYYLAQLAREMSDDQKTLYFYYRAKDKENADRGKETHQADDYLTWLSKYELGEARDATMGEERMEQYHNASAVGKIAANIASIGEKFVGDTKTTIEAAKAAITGIEYDGYSRATDMSRMAGYTRQAAMEEIAEYESSEEVQNFYNNTTFGQVLNYLCGDMTPLEAAYNIGMNAGDNGIRAILVGVGCGMFNSFVSAGSMTAEAAAKLTRSFGFAVSNSAMAVTSFGDAMNQNLDKVTSGEWEVSQLYANALASAANEVIQETVFSKFNAAIDANTIHDFASFRKWVGSTFLDESLQEGLGGELDVVFDGLVNYVMYGDETEIAEKYNQYTASGMDGWQAALTCFYEDCMLSPFVDWWQGGVGGVLGGGVNAASNWSANRGEENSQNDQAGSRIIQGGDQAVYNTIKVTLATAPKDSQTYKSAWRQLQEMKKNGFVPIEEMTPEQQKEYMKTHPSAQHAQAEENAAAEESAETAEQQAEAEQVQTPEEQQTTEQEQTPEEQQTTEQEQTPEEQQTPEENQTEEAAPEDQDKGEAEDNGQQEKFSDEDIQAMIDLVEEVESNPNSTEEDIQEARAELQMMQDANRAYAANMNGSTGETEQKDNGTAGTETAQTSVDEGIGETPSSNDINEEARQENKKIKKKARKRGRMIAKARTGVTDESGTEDKESAPSSNDANEEVQKEKQQGLKPSIDGESTNADNEEARGEKQQGLKPSVDGASSNAVNEEQAAEDTKHMPASQRTGSTEAQDAGSTEEAAPANQPAKGQTNPLTYFDGSKKNVRELGNIFNETLKLLTGNYDTQYKTENGEKIKTLLEQDAGSEGISDTVVDSMTAIADGTASDTEIDAVHAWIETHPDSVVSNVLSDIVNRENQFSSSAYSPKLSETAQFIQKLILAPYIPGTDEYNAASDQYAARNKVMAEIAKESGGDIVGSYMGKVSKDGKAYAVGEKGSVELKDGIPTEYDTRNGVLVGKTKVAGEEMYFPANAIVGQNDDEGNLMGCITTYSGGNAQTANLISAGGRAFNGTMRAYNDALNRAQQLGFFGISEDRAESMFKTGIKETDEALKAVYKRGIEARNKVNKNQRAKTGKNSVKVDTSALKGKELNEYQQNALEIFETFAQTGTMNIRLFESKADENGIITQNDGEYDPSTNTISIDINAGIDFLNSKDARKIAGQMMAKVFSHELTHYIQSNDAEGYQVLVNVLMDAYRDERGLTFNKLVSVRLAMMEQQQEDLIQAKEKGETLTKEQEAFIQKDSTDLLMIATDETVASACEFMLENSKYAQEIANRVARENMTLADKIRQFISDFIGKIKKAFASYSQGVASAEAWELKNAEAKKLEKVQEAWDNALKTAMENQAAKNSEISEENAEKIKNNAPVSLGIEIQNSTRNDALYMKAAAEANRKAAFVSSEVMELAKRQRAIIKEIFDRDNALPENERRLLLPADNEGDTFFADGSYSGSEENTSECIRSMSAQALMDAVSDELGRPMTVFETLYVSQQLAGYMRDTGRQECYYCYVATDRRAYREYLGNYISDRGPVIDEIMNGDYTVEDLEGLKDRIDAFEEKRKAETDKKKKAAMKPDGLDGIYYEFLGGRKNTANMAHRFGMWMEIVKGGYDLIQDNDLANLENLNKEMSDLTQRIVDSATEIKKYKGKKTFSVKYNKDMTELQVRLEGDKEKVFMPVSRMLKAGTLSAEDYYRFIQLKDAADYAQGASWAKKMVPYVAYNNHILKWTEDKVKKLNDHYGLRMYSFSDFSPAFILENMQMFTDAAVKGLNVLAYTKEMGFVDVFAGTGANINISTFCGAMNAQADENSDERYAPDVMQGADWTRARNAREKSIQDGTGVGITMVVVNDDQLKWALSRDWIDVVIPYHLVRTGADVAEWFGYKNYTAVSADRKMDDFKEYWSGKGLTEDQIKKLERSVSPVKHMNDIVKYVEELEKMRLTPRFAEQLTGYDEFVDALRNKAAIGNDAYYQAEVKFRAANPYYMKLVNETRRSYADTKAVQPVFNVQMDSEGNGVINESGEYDVGTAQYWIEEMAKQGGYYVPAGGSIERQYEIAGDLAENIKNGEAVRAKQDQGADGTAEKRSSYRGTTYDGIRAYESEFPEGMSTEEKGKIFEKRISTIFNLGAVSLNVGMKKITVEADTITKNKNIGGDFNSNDIDAKYDLLYDYADILEHSKMFGEPSMEPSYKDPSVKPKNKAHKGVKYWYHFKNTVILGESVINVIFNIRDKGKNQYQYLIEVHNVGDATKKQLRSILHTTKSLRIHLSAATDDDRLTYKSDSVKGTSRKSERNIRYMAAVQSGDMETAQRLVDEAANDAGYNAEYVYWRGDADAYNVLEAGEEGGNLGHGLYFTPSRQYAERFAWGNGVVRKFYLKANPVDITSGAIQQEFNDFLKDYFDDEYIDIDTSPDYISDEEWAEAFDAFAESKDADSLSGTNVGGLAFGASETKVNESWQAKLADPVTYDDDGNVIPLDERFNENSEDIRYSARNTQYMAAVQSGDMETAQQLVDEAAKDAGWTVADRYHQTGVKFTQFDNSNPTAGKYDSDTPNGYFFKANDHDIGVGDDYVKTGHGGNIQMRVYLKAKNMLHFKNRDEAHQWYTDHIDGYSELDQEMKRRLDPIDADMTALEDRYYYNEEIDDDEFEKQWHDMLSQMSEIENAYRAEMKNLLNEYFLNGGSEYDGIELDNDGHRYIDGKREDVHTFIVFSPEQIKSADPVTYDDNGDVVPLDQRFNEDNSDIRFSTRAQLDDAYAAAVARGDMQTAMAMLAEKAKKTQADLIEYPDVTTYSVHRGAAPKKTIKVYKTFTVDEQGRPTALFVSSNNPIPVGVWLDAQDTFHFMDQKNGKWYVPSTKNPNTKGGATGRQTKLTDISAEDLAELEKRGYITKEEDGNYTAQYITSLAYRPGWHAGDLPFFPQGGMQIKGSNYKNVHRYNQVVFECEMSADTDYTNFEIKKGVKVKVEDMDESEIARAIEEGVLKRKKDGTLPKEFTDKRERTVFHDRQEMPENGSYKFATNPMANASDIGSWYISGNLRIVRALSEEECNAILEENGRPAQEWQAYQDAGERSAALEAAKEPYTGITGYTKNGKAKYGITDKKAAKSAADRADYDYEHRMGTLDLDRLNVDQNRTDAYAKLAEVTYDDDGNLIPLSQRYNTEIADPRYSERTGNLTDRDLLQMASDAVAETETEKSYMAMYKDTTHKMSQLYQDIQGEREEMLRYRAAGNTAEENKSKNRIGLMNEQLDEYIEKASKLEESKPLTGVMWRIRHETEEAVMEALTQVRDAASSGEGLSEAELDKALKEQAHRYELEIVKLKDRIKTEQARTAEAKNGPNQSKRRGRAPDTKKLIDSLEKRIKQLQTRLAAVDNSSAKQLAREVQKRDKAIENMKERRKASETRQKIRRIIDNFNQRLAHPREGKYIPADMVRGIITALESFDLSYVRNGEERVGKSIRDMYDIYDRYKKDGEYTYYNEVIAGRLEQLAEEMGDTKFRNLKNDQLEKIYQIMLGLHKVVTEAVQLKTMSGFKDAIEAGDLAIKQVQEADPLIKGKPGEILNWMSSPDNFFKRISGFAKNSVLSQMQREIVNGEQTMLEIQRDYVNTFAEYTAGKDFKRLNAHKAKDLVDVGLKDKDTGDPIMITRGMMLSLYMHLDSDDNLRGIARGGIKVPNLTRYYEKNPGAAFDDETATRTEGIQQRTDSLYDDYRENGMDETQARIETAKDRQAMEDAEVANLDAMRGRIWDMLTDDEKGMVQAAHEWFDKKSRTYINGVSMDLYGFKVAAVEHYFPIHRDSNFLNKQFESVSNDASLANMGFLKERVKASQPIMLMDFAYEMASSVDQTSRYVGFARAERDFNMLYKAQLPGMTTSLREQIGKKFHSGDQKIGVTGMQYIENYINGIIGNNRSKQTVWDTIRGNLARSTLTLNPRVALSQAASIPTAVAELDLASVTAALKDIGIAFNGKAKDQLAQDDIWFWQRYRGEGGMTEFADAKQNGTKLDRIYNTVAGTKVGKALMNWCQDFDVGSTAIIHKATENWVTSHMGYTQGSEEWKQAVADKYRDVLRRTQPMYMTTARSDVMRSSDAIMKTFTMFKTQASQNLNTLYNASAEFRKFKQDLANGANDVTAEDVREARERFRNSIAGVAMGAIAYAVFRFLINALMGKTKKYKDDDTDEMTMMSTVKGIGLEALSSLSSMVVFGDAVYTAAESMITKSTYYGISETAVGQVDALVTSIVDTTQSVGTDKFGDNVTSLFSDLAGVLGLPLDNMKNVANMATYYVNGMTSGVFESSATRTDNTMYNRMIGAMMDGNDEEYEQLLAEEMKLSDKSTKEAQAGLKNRIAYWYENGAMTREEAEELLTGEYMGLDEDDVYWLLDKSDYKMEHGGKSDGYDKTLTMQEAIKNGSATAIESAIDYYKQHGYYGKTETVVKNAAKALYDEDAIDWDTVQNVMVNYGGMTTTEKNVTTADTDGLYWLQQQWDWEKSDEATLEDSSYNKYQALDDAVEKMDMATAAEQVAYMMEHGITKSGIASHLASLFKSTYLEMLDADPASAETYLNNVILPLYVAAGYSASTERAYIAKKWK